MRSLHSAGARKGGLRRLQGAQPEGPAGTRDPEWGETCQARGGGGARALSEVARASAAAFLSHPSPFPVPPRQVSPPPKAKKGNSEGFLEPAPRGLSELGRSQRGREGPEKGREERGGQTKGPVHL